jgi:isocitrate dehydrogenase
MSNVIRAKTVTYDLARLMDGATEVSCSGFGDAMIAHLSSERVATLATY